MGSSPWWRTWTASGSSRPTCPVSARRRRFPAAATICRPTPTGSRAFAAGRRAGCRHPRALVRFDRRRGGRRRRPADPPRDPRQPDRRSRAGGSARHPHPPRRLLLLGGARLPKRAGRWRSCATARSCASMSVSMAKTRDAELRRFIHDQHDTYFSRFADRDVLHDAFLGIGLARRARVRARGSPSRRCWSRRSATTSRRSRRSGTSRRCSRMPSWSRSRTSVTSSTTRRRRRRPRRSGAFLRLPLPVRVDVHAVAAVAGVAVALRPVARVVDVDGVAVVAPSTPARGRTRPSG